MDELTGLVAVTMLLGMPTAAFAMYTFYRVRKLRSEGKTLILITDGVDNGSKRGVEEAMQAAQQADAVVFAINYVPESHGGTDGKRPLEKLAEPTGGRVFSLSGKMPLERVFACGMRGFQLT